VASSGAQSVRQVMEAVKHAQGWPLALIEKAAKVGQIDITPDQVILAF